MKMLWFFFLKHVGELCIISFRRREGTQGEMPWIWDCFFHILRTWRGFIISTSWSPMSFRASWACSSIESLTSLLKKDTSSDMTPSPFKSIEPSCKLVCSARLTREKWSHEFLCAARWTQNFENITSAFSRTTSVAPAFLRSNKCERSWALAYIGTC